MAPASAPAAAPWPTELRVIDDRHTLSITFEDGALFDVKVHQKDDKGGMEWKPPTVTTSGRFKKRLEEQMGLKDVTCPDGLISAKKGSKVTCSGKLEEQMVDVEAVFEDDEGRYGVRTTPKL